MNLNEMLADGSLKPFQPQGSQIKDLISSGSHDLEAARQLVTSSHYGIARDTAYEAMLKFGMALMFEHGYRPESGSHHVIVVRFTEHILGKEHIDLITAFDRLRRSRHQRLYQGKEIGTRAQAESAIAAARELLAAVGGFIEA